MLAEAFFRRLSMKRFSIILAITLIITSIITVLSIAKESENITDEFIRLHIRANSNSKEDQEIKLKVRDLVLKETEHLFKDVISPEEAKRVISDNINIFSEAANNALSNLGVDYKAKAVFDREYFTTREYNNFTLPAGFYDALIINLGSGRGDNWWCVIYPTLCYSGDKVTIDKNNKGRLSDEDYALLTGAKKEKKVVRFKIAEFFGQVKKLFK